MKKGLIRGALVLVGILMLQGIIGMETKAARLNKKSIVIDRKTNYQLTIRGTKKKVTWSSENERVATISPKGRVRGRSVGETVITAKYGKRKLICKVTVREPMRYYGHRGFRSQYPENTIPAFTGAMKAGFQGVEMDVFETDDGEIMVFHDDTIDRMCRGTGSIYDITPRNRKKYWINAGKNIAKYNTQRKRLYIPTLEEAVKAMKKRDATIYIHLKGARYITDAGINKMEQVLRKHDMVDQSIIFATGGNILSRFEARGLNIGIGIGVTPVSKAQVEEKLQECIERGGDSFIVFWPSDVTRKLVRRCKEEGIDFGVYNVKTKAEARRLHNMGVDFVFSRFALFK